MLIVSSVGDDAEVGRRAQPAAGDEPRDVLAGDVGDVGLAPIDGVDLALIEVDAGRDEAGAGELDRERQADVAEADDADARGAGVDARARLGDGPAA